MSRESNLTVLIVCKRPSVINISDTSVTLVSPFFSAVHSNSKLNGSKGGTNHLIFGIQDDNELTFCILSTIFSIFLYTAKLGLSSRLMCSAFDVGKTSLLSFGGMGRSGGPCPFPEAQLKQKKDQSSQ